MFEYEDPVTRSEFSESQSGTSSRFSGSEEPRKKNSDELAEDSDEKKLTMKGNHKPLDLCGIGFSVRDCLRCCYLVLTGANLRIKR